MWNGGYQAVWHLGSDLTDATGNPNTGTPTGTTIVPAVIGNGRNFDGSSYVTIPILAGNESLNITSSLTMEAWAYRRGAGYQSMVAKYEYSPPDRSYLLGFNYREDYSGADGPCAVVSTDKYFNLNGLVEDPALPQVNTWQHIAAVFGSNRLRLYVNGTRVADKNPGFTTLWNSSEPVIIGGCDNGSVRFNGILDEVRISAAARSDSWIRAQYLSMTDDLITYGPRQTQ